MIRRDRRLHRLWAPLLPTLARLDSHRTTLIAAGCAFYATLSLFPGTSMLLALYGLMFDASQVEAQLEQLHTLMPPDAFRLISRGAHALSDRSNHMLGLNLGLAALVMLWTSMTGAKAVIAALNIAYDEPERRSMWQLQVIGLGMTLAAATAVVLALGLLVALPALAETLGLHWGMGGLLHAAGLALIVLVVAGALAGLYHFGPSRPPGRRHRVLPGTLAGTCLWLVAAELFSIYVAQIGNFNATYGPLGAVAGVMLWFWFASYAVLAGAELNSALELQAEGRQGRALPGPAKGPRPWIPLHKTAGHGE